MSQVTARLPDELVEALDAAARDLKRSRAEVIRPAIERYIENFDDLSVAIDRLRDPSDPVPTGMTSGVTGDNDLLALASAFACLMVAARDFLTHLELE